MTYRTEIKEIHIIECLRKYGKLELFQVDISQDSLFLLLMAKKKTVLTLYMTNAKV